MCVWEREERERERERTSGLSQSVRVFFFLPPFTLFLLFHVMGLVLLRKNGRKKEHIIIIIIRLTCHLRFVQNDWSLLRATAVTWG